MGYDDFQKGIANLIQRAGGNIRVRFFNDTEKGKYIAKFSDGTTVVGRPSSLKVTVSYGSGHQAMTTI
jgi:hypothetical protein